NPCTPRPYMANTLPLAAPSRGIWGCAGRPIDVTYNASSDGPPNITLVTFFTGISITRSTDPSGQWRTTLPWQTRALHRHPSASTVEPSGAPPTDGSTRTWMRRFETAPLAGS